MTLRWAVVDGDWEDPATWDGGLTVPGAGDDVYANEHEITIHASFTVKSLRNAEDLAHVPPLDSGYYFMIQPSATPIVITITDGILQSHSSGHVALIMEVLPGTGNVTVNADIEGSAVANREKAIVLNNGYLGTFTLNGDVKGGNDNSYGLWVRCAAIVIVNGNVLGGDAYPTYGSEAIYTDMGAPDIRINGNVQGGIGQGAYGVNLDNPGCKLQIIGDARAGQGVSYSPAVECYETSAEISIRGGTITGGPHRWNYALELNSGASTPGIALRIDSDVVWGDTMPIYLESVRSMMLWGDGTNASFQLREDTGWPDDTGAFVTVGGGDEGDGSGELGWFTVRAEGILAVADSDDAGGEPDRVPIIGTVTFTPSLSRPIKILSSNEILAVAQVVATFDANGKLSYDGQENVRLIAPQWTDLSNTAWVWQVEVRPATGQNWTAWTASVTALPGAVVNLSSYL